MKIKTSISIDRELWIELKTLASRQGKDVSSTLKDAIENELISDLNKSLAKYSIMNTSDLDFEPIKIDRGISDLVRSMRDDRENSISGH
jgi:predicted DNA-binding protein